MYLYYRSIYILPCDSPLCCNVSTRACNCAWKIPYWINPCGWYA